MSEEEQSPAPPPPRRPRLAGLLAPVLTVGAVTAAALPSAGGLAAGTVPMLYLAAVVLAALAGGLWAALLGAALAFAAYDFYFVEPRYTFAVTDPSAVVALTVFVGLALATGTLAARVTEQAARRDAEARSTAALLHFARRLAMTSGRDAVLSLVVHQLARLFGGEVVFVAHEGGQLTLMASSPKRLPLSARETEAARLALAGAPGDGRGYDYRPVAVGNRTLALVGIKRAQMLSPEENGILAGLLDQTSVALDRSERARESAAAEARAESERLQGALLASISHDLRTPLAAITGAASSLGELGDRMPAETRADLLRVIEEEAGTLNRFVANLLDITRIESGQLSPRREPVDVADAAQRALARVQRLAPDFAVETSIAPGLPLAEGDAVLVEQMLFNLLDNARNYAGTAPATLFARSEENSVLIAVTDQGPGIAAKDLPHVFEKFFRGSATGHGTGLGLSIVKGFATAMGGTVSVESPAVRRQGTRFTICLKRAVADG